MTEGPSKSDLIGRLRDCMIVDRARLLRAIERLGGGGTSPSSPRGAVPTRSQILALSGEIEHSVRTAEKRAASVPAVSFPADLPVSQRRDEIGAMIRDNQVVVVCGETGSGKSTQLPKILLSLGRGVRGMIGHTQPRRIAARSIAARVAEELGTELGSVVGYKVRFGDQTSERTLVKVLTDGMLLAETQGDRFLEKYDTIIIDEAHERSLNIDFLLGYLRQLLPKRPDLKVIITSATIDPDRFARHFGRTGGAGGAGGVPAPVVMVSGRTYPVEVRHRPIEELDENERDDRLEHAVVDGVNELCREGQGDILVFLCGEREIRETADLLAETKIVGWSGAEQIDILPLFARLSASEQMRAFRRERGETRRRVVLATNVAETSVTVPGIRSVIDTGLVRLSRYSTRTKTQRLPIEPISQASANQRAGRCGRLGPGVCIRLYSEEELSRAPAFTEPEILRTNLASVILQMKALGLGEPERFPFVEAPDGRLIQDGYDTLAELGAVQEERDGRWTLTDLGRQMAKLPVDPRIARMVLAGIERGCVKEVLVIAAGLSVQDPRERPFDLAQQADEAHAPFRDPDSDFLSFLKLWEWFGEQARGMSGSKVRKMCAAKHLSYVRLREWQDVHRQLSEMVAELTAAGGGRSARPERGAKRAGEAGTARPAQVRGWKGGGASEPTYEQIHCALLCGLLSSIGTKHDHFEYNGARASRFSIFPGSGLFKKSPKWVMASELVRTTRLYARCCATIKPEWAERVGSHMLKRSYSDPFYDDASQRVLAFERVTLLGLELATKRIAHYGPVNPAEARAIFIQHALVEAAAGEGGKNEGSGEGRNAGNGLRTSGRFLAHNCAVLARVRMMEHKLRRSDILAGPIKRFEFYDTRLGRDVYSGQTFEKWRETAERLDPRVLFMSDADAMAAVPDEDALTKFPDTLAHPGATLDLRYRAEPGHVADGVTAVVPVEALNRVDETRGEYLVPGLLIEKIDALIRTLPKNLRTAFVPVARFAGECATALRDSREPLTEGVARVLTGISGVDVRPEHFRPGELSEHLRMNYAVVDRGGKEIATGRDLGPIRRELAATLDAAMASVPDRTFNREGITRWDFGDLPEEAEVTHERLRVRGKPVLVDAGASVSLKLMASKNAAPLTHRQGVIRLFALCAKRELEKCVRAVGSFNRMGVLFGTLGNAGDLRQQMIDRTAETVFLADAAEIRLEREFVARLRDGEAKISAVMQRVGREVLATLEASQRALRAIEEARNPAIIANVADARENLERLVFRGFLARVPHDVLEDYPRFLSGIETRVRKLIAKGAAVAGRDRELALEIAGWWSRYVRQRIVNEERKEPDGELEVLRWMIEEFRVSLFAQELGTKYTISPQRLEKQWAKVRQT